MQWKHFLDGRRPMFFQDNYAVLDRLINGTAHDGTWRSLFLAMNFVMRSCVFDVVFSCAFILKRG